MSTPSSVIGLEVGLYELVRLAFGLIGALLEKSRSLTLLTRPDFESDSKE